MSSDPHDPEIERAWARLHGDLPRVTPRDDLFDRITAALPAHAVRVTPSRKPVARRRRRLRRPTFAIPAGAALVALVAALVIALAVSGDPAPAASGALIAHGGDGVRGKVDVFDPSSASGRVVVHLRGLAVAPAGDHYTIWVLRDGVRAMTPVASIVSGEDARIDLPLPGPGRYTAVDISLQRNDASPVHSGVSVASAKLG